MDQTTGISGGYAMNNLMVDDTPFNDLRLKRLWQTLGEVMTKR